MDCKLNYGLNFGYDKDNSKHDLFICDNSDIMAYSSSNLGATYDNLGIIKDLIGDNKLILEIEVFTI